MTTARISSRSWPKCSSTRSCPTSPNHLPTGLRPIVEDCFQFDAKQRATAPNVGSAATCSSFIRALIMPYHMMHLCACLKAVSGVCPHATPRFAIRTPIPLDSVRLPCRSLSRSWASVGCQDSHECPKACRCHARPAKKERQCRVVRGFLRGFAPETSRTLIPPQLQAGRLRAQHDWPRTSTWELA